MYILDIFFKKRKFTEIFEKAWIVIGNNITLAQDGENGTDPTLEMYYFVSMVYSTVFHCAEAAGMSSSSAHYLARMQAKDSKVDPPIVEAAKEIFAVPDDEKIRAYADYLYPRIQEIVAAAVKSETGPEQTATKQTVDEIYSYFQQCGFSAEELFATED
jgi:hypothetical protein